MWQIANNHAGIGLRSEHIPALITQPKRQDIDFLELAPDNWMNLGGAKKEYLADIAKKYPLIAHGLSLSIGDVCPLNSAYIHDIRRFWMSIILIFTATTCVSHGIGKVTFMTCCRYPVMPTHCRTWRRVLSKCRICSAVN
ncbi:Protein of uncharacterised function (DUF692) [Serratia rubidaea]|uniref:Protein of uncharacterized function (DUF692) n=1 Tax=Serratia rubidaea TaxID=61652 RepID=A0A3S4FRM8_SERRU|nr:Protein of uncharacterised function (DUF692) [Serratia rubidaea]